MQGKRFSGVPIYQVLESFDGKPVSSPDEFDLALITYKEIYGGQSRTIGNYAAQMAIMPENFVYLNEIDAKRLGLVDGDTVRVESAVSTGASNWGRGRRRVKWKARSESSKGFGRGSSASLITMATGPTGLEMSK